MGIAVRRPPQHKSANVFFGHVGLPWHARLPPRVALGCSFGNGDGERTALTRRESGQCAAAERELIAYVSDSSGGRFRPGTWVTLTAGPKRLLAASHSTPIRMENAPGSLPRRAPSLGWLPAASFNGHVASVCAPGYTEFRSRTPSGAAGSPSYRHIASRSGCGEPCERSHNVIGGCRQPSGASASPLEKPTSCRERKNRHE